MTSRSYWIGVVSRNHVERGVAGGFAQLNHGKAGPLERMQPGDGFVYYSPRTEFPDGPPVQAFTAIGRVASGPIFQVESADAPFFRREVQYLPAAEAPIKPLIEELSFIRSKQHWGAAFRAHRQGHGPRLRARLPRRPRGGQLVTGGYASAHRATPSGP